MSNKPEWKNKYPYLLDAHLVEAISIALKAEDYVMARNLWQIFISYRKTEAGKS